MLKLSIDGNVVSRVAAFISLCLICGTSAYPSFVYAGPTNASTKGLPHPTTSQRAPASAATQASLGSTEPKISFEITPTQKWSTDAEGSSIAPGNKRLVFERNEKIDILLSFTNENLLAEIDKLGKDKAVSQLMNAKNKMLQLVSDRSAVLKSASLQTIPSGKLLTLETEFTYGPKVYRSIDHYYLFPSKALHAVLRWNAESKADDIRLAKQDFATLKVAFEGAK